MNRWMMLVRLVVTVLVVRIAVELILIDVRGGWSWWLVLDVTLLLLAAAIVVDVAAELVRSFLRWRARRDMRRRLGIDP